MQQAIGYLAAFLCTGLVASAPAQADTTRAECGFAETVNAPRGETSACVFSQRQGFVTVSIDGGEDFDFRPTDQAPGNYLNANGQAVYRRSGLGEAGQIFQLPERFLFVYWDASTLACTGAALSSESGCRLATGDLAFQLQATAGSSINQLTVQATGLVNSTEPFIQEIDGMAYGAELADLDANGWPEIYIYISSAGSGSYGSLVAYGVNNGLSMSPIYLPPLIDNAQASAGYQGHDEFGVVENRLVQRFPVYLPGDTNSQPTGGMHQVQYQLVAGEAGWVLKPEAD